jgi:hypothetical protein
MIMKKQCLIYLLLSCVLSGFAQQIPEKLVYRDSIPALFAWKDSVVALQKGRNKKSYITINDRITDTISTESSWGRIISSNDRRNRDVIFEMGDIIRLSLETGKTDTLLGETGKLRYRVAVNNQLIGTDSCYYLVSYDIATKQKKQLYDLRTVCFNTCLVEASPTGTLLLSFSDNDDPDINYYTFDLEKGVLEKKDFSKYLDKINADNTVTTISIGIVHDDITAQYAITGLYWMDGAFNAVQPTISRPNRNNRGFKIKQSDPYYYLSSRIDGSLRKFGKDVWIPCRFTLAFDMGLYKIYNSMLLSKEELKGFDTWELHKLKNMVYAKYNYKFDSHYLQAFYNMFSFYARLSAMEERTKEVSHLLTPEDQSNLKLIEQAMSQQAKNIP